MRPVHVITDTGSDLPAGLAAEYTISIVPLTVSFGDETFISDVTITREEFLRRMTTSPDFPKTAAPSVEDFRQEYACWIDQGMDVLCLCLSSGLSSTYNSARLAADGIPPERIRVIDTKCGGMQQGWIAVEAARVAAAGGSLDDCVAAAEAVIPTALLQAIFDTLEYIHKGGRLSKGAQLLGTALSIKPVLGIGDDGTVQTQARPRTFRKAVNAVVEQAIQDEPTDIAILHTGRDEMAQDVAETFRKALPGVRLVIDFAGCIIGSYGGPGALEIAYIPRRQA